MDLSRRTALEAGLGALATVSVAGCVDDTADDGTSDDTSTDDDSPTDDSAAPGDESANRSADDDTETDSDVENDTVTEDDHSDDYPEDFDEPNGNETGTTGETGYETYAVGGEGIPMAPTADVYEWYANDEELLLVDARSKWGYQRRHIEGAVWSPSPDGRDADDPLEDVATDRRIVTYCTCPRTLSGHRAAALVEEGYTDVYLLRDGLQDWVEQGHPIAGTNVE